MGQTTPVDNGKISDQGIKYHKIFLIVFDRLDIGNTWRAGGGERVARQRGILLFVDMFLSIDVSEDPSRLLKIRNCGSASGDLIRV